MSKAGSTIIVHFSYKGSQFPRLVYYRHDTLGGIGTFVVPIVGSHERGFKAILLASVVSRFLLPIFLIFLPGIRIKNRDSTRKWKIYQR